MSASKPSHGAKKHIVLSTFGSFGDLHPCIAIGIELMTRGHRATIATSEVYRAKIESEGLEFHAVRPDLPQPHDERELMARVMDVRRGTEVVLRELTAPHVADGYADIRPLLDSADLVVTHALSFAAHLYAEKSGMPWVSTVLQPSSMFSLDDPPSFPRWDGILRNRWVSRLIYPPLFRQIRRALDGWLAPVTQFRREIGLPPTDKNPLMDGQFSPHCNLALFSSVIGQPQPDWPANTLVTGFPFYDRLTATEGLPAALEDFLSAGDAPIVFTLGSAAVAHAGDFYAQSADAAARLGRRAVLLVGRDPANIPGALPDGVVACAYAPHSELFPRAVAIVHQGGIGTIGQALRSGRPMLVVPFSHDQPDNAARVCRLNVARSITRSRYTAKRAAAEMRMLIEDQRYAVKASAIGSQIRAETGTSTAVDAIEETLARAPHRPTKSG